MIRGAGALALALVGIWVIAHLLYIGPVRDAAEITLLWIAGFTAASLVIAAMVLLGVGLVLGETRPVWLPFVRRARTAGAVAGSALVLIGMLHYRDTEPRGEIHWLALGVAVLGGALVVHWWLVRAERRATA